MNFTNAARHGARVTSTQAFTDWWFGKTKGGIDSLYVDPRTPNGGGKYNSSLPDWHLCVPFNMPGSGSR